MPQNPLDALKSAFAPAGLSQQLVDGLPPLSPEEAAIKEREAINRAVSGQASPPPAPFTPQTNPPGPVSQGPFTFQQQTPDIEGLVNALQQAGIARSSARGNIELPPQR